MATRSETTNDTEELFNRADRLIQRVYTSLGQVKQTDNINEAYSLGKIEEQNDLDSPKYKLAQLSQNQQKLLSVSRSDEKVDLKKKKKRMRSNLPDKDTDEGASGDFS